MKRSTSIWMIALSAVIALSACSVKDVGPPREQAQAGNFRTQTVLLPGHPEPTEVGFEVKDGKAIFEGDIVLGEVDAQGYLLDDGLGDSGELGSQAIIIEFDNYRWPDGIVPYEVSSSVSAQGKVNIQDAVAHWNTKTPVQLVQRDPAIHDDYVAFVKGSDSESCASDIGRRGGRQEIQLMSDGDCPRGALIHEIGHAVGLWHEQSRADRDEYVTIHYDNVDNGASWNPFDGAKYQFDKHVTDGMDVGPYDYNSIMHYGCKQYSVNGKNTITPKDPDVGCSAAENKPDGYIGQLDNLSDGDKAAINALYAFRVVEGDIDFGCDGSRVCEFGDVNDDGMDDIVRFVRSSQSGAGQGDVYVARSSGGRWHLQSKWEDNFCASSTEVCTTGDFNGDFKDDIVAFHNGAYNGSGAVFAALSNGTSFVSDKLWESNFCIHDTEVCMTGDFNGDSKDDIVAFHNGAYNGSGAVYVALSNGVGFVADRSWHSDFCRDGETCAVGDVNNDEMDDIISFTGGGEVHVALSLGGTFGPKKKVHDDFCYDGAKCSVGDVDGDRRADLLAFTKAPYYYSSFNSCSYQEGCGDVYIALSEGTIFGDSYKSHGRFLMDDDDTVLVGQVDNDRGGKADLLDIGSSSHKVLVSQMK